MRKIVVEERKSVPDNFPAQERFSQQKKNQKKTSFNNFTELFPLKNIVCVQIDTLSPGFIIIKMESLASCWTRNLSLSEYLSRYDTWNLSLPGLRIALGFPRPPAVGYPLNKGQVLYHLQISKKWWQIKFWRENSNIQKKLFLALKFKYLKMSHLNFYAKKLLTLITMSVFCQRLQNVTQGYISPR